MVDLLRAVIQAACVPQADRVGGGKQTEMRVWANDFVLVQKRQLTGDFQHALNDEHHIRATGIIFVKHHGYRILQRPWQNAFLKLGHLLAVFQHNRVFTDQINTADMAVEIDPHTRPVEPGCNLLNMRRFTGAVIALHHDAAIMGKARQQCHCGLLVEQIIFVKIRHILAAFGEGRNRHINIDTEYVAGIDLAIRGIRHLSDRHAAFLGRYTH